MGLMDLVQDATEVDTINSAIIFGRYGVGKTLLAASASEIADYAPVLIVDIEGSAAGVGRVFPDVKIIKVDSFKKLEAVRKMLREEEHPFKTVIFDTLNVAQDRAEKYIKNKPEYANNKFAVWGELKEWTVEFVREQHAAPYMAIFTAHPQDDKDEDTGKITTTLAVSGSAKREVPTIVDLVGFLDIAPDDAGNPVRVLRTDATTGIITKNRFGLPTMLRPAEGKKFIRFFDIQMAILAAKDNIDE